MAPVRTSSFSTIDNETRDQFNPVARYKTLRGLLSSTATIHARRGNHFLKNGIDGDHTFLSYADLVQRADLVAGQLISAGVTPDTVALLYLSSHEEYTTVFWACQWAGVIPCVLTPLTQDHNQRVAHLSHLFRLLSPKVITSPSLVKDLSVVPELDVIELPALMSLPCSPLPVHIISPDDIACLMLTSGSTGMAKAVELTHRNILYSIAGKSKSHGTHTQSVFFNWINFDHVACLTEIHLHAMYVGADQHHLPAADLLPTPLDFLRLVEREGVTYTFAPQFFLTAIERALSSKKATFNLPANLRIISGGEACSTKICQTLVQDYMVGFGASPNVISPGFGMTETCAGSIYGHNFPKCDVDGGRENGSLGWCTSAIEMRVMDPETNSPVGRNVQGELQVRGAAVFGRYYRNPQATADSFTKDGWFRTGDCAYVCDDGLVMSGRGKDSIIINGVKYFSSELEGMLEDANISGLASSWVTAFPVTLPGEVVEEVVILYKPMYEPSQDPALHFATVRTITDNCIRYCSTKPRAVVALPEQVFGAKSTLGKLSRPKLRKRYEAGEFQAYETAQVDLLEAHGRSTRVAPQGRYEEVVAATIAEVFGIPKEDIGREDNFFELGGSSMELLRFKGLLSQQLETKTDIPLTAIFTAPTVREIAETFEYADTKEHVYSPIVPLQMPRYTDKHPFFFFHPGVGEVLVFIQLSNYMKDRHVYGIRASGFNPGEELFQSFDEMIDTYYNAVREKQPHGPYHFAGYSYGGIVAFEVAKRCEADGEEVRFLATLDRSPHIKAFMKTFRWIDDVIDISHLLGLLNAKQVAALKVVLTHEPRRDVFSHILSLAPAEVVEQFEMDEAKLARWTSIGHRLHQLGQNYEPTGRLKTTMHAFYADPLPLMAPNREEWAKHLERWSEFSSTEPILYSCPGHHYTMIGEHYVEAFQEMFLKALAKSESESS